MKVNCDKVTAENAAKGPAVWYSIPWGVVTKLFGSEKCLRNLDVKKPKCPMNQTTFKSKT